MLSQLILGCQQDAGMLEGLDDKAWHLGVWLKRACPCVHMCVHICQGMHACLYAYLFACVHKCVSVVCVHTFGYLCKSSQMYVCTHVCMFVCVHMCARMCACLCVHTRVCACTQIYVHTCVCVHVSLHACVHVHVCTSLCECGHVFTHVSMHACLCAHLCASVCACVFGMRSAAPEAAGWGSPWPCWSEVGRGGGARVQRPVCVRTCVGRAMGQRQVGAGAPGPRAEAPLALAAVRARGVVLTLALQAALTHGAQVGVQVALAPGGTWRGQGISEHVSGLFRLPGRLGECRGGQEGTLKATCPTCQDSPLGQVPLMHHSESFQKEVPLAPASHGVVPDAVFLVTQLLITMAFNHGG